MLTFLLPVANLSTLVVMDLDHVAVIKHLVIIPTDLEEVATVTVTDVMVLISLIGNMLLVVQPVAYQIIITLLIYVKVVNKLCCSLETWYLYPHTQTCPTPNQSNVNDDGRYNILHLYRKMLINNLKKNHHVHTYLIHSTKMNHIA
jgi:hypothetical protein